MGDAAPARAKKRKFTNGSLGTLAPMAAKVARKAVRAPPAANTTSNGAGVEKKLPKQRNGKGKAVAADPLPKRDAVEFANGTAAAQPAKAAASAVRDGASNWRLLLASQGAAAALATPEDAADAKSATKKTVNPPASLKRSRPTELMEAAKREAESRAAQKLKPNGGRSSAEDPESVPDEEKAKYVALDCEMVGVGPSGKRNALAQCCVVDWDGEVLYSRHVRPELRVTDFRTWVSGVSAKHLKVGEAVTMQRCQADVAALLKGKVLVGHALQNDLKALLLTHPKSMIRDTAQFRPFRHAHGKGGGKLRPRALRKLALEYLGMEIQTGEHDPAEDARAAMRLYQLKRREWEASLKAARKGPRVVNQSLPSSGDRQRSAGTSIVACSGTAEPDKDHDVTGADKSAGRKPERAAKRRRVA